MTQCLGQTISDFRELLIKMKTFEGLFDSFLAQLKKIHGLALAKAGVMADACFAEVPQTLLDNASVNAHKVNAARWTKKNNGAHYGYKDHVKVDVKDKLIFKAVITPASPEARACV